MAGVEAKRPPAALVLPDAYASARGEGNWSLGGGGALVADPGDRGWSYGFCHVLEALG